ncbi:hypothetical protein R6Q59_036362 [Mikania micrantha]
MSVKFSNELKSLAHGPLNAYVYTTCIVNGVRFVVHCHYVQYDEKDDEDEDDEDVDDDVKEGGAAQHVEGWRDMHYKGSLGWYNELAEQHWDNITDELNKAKSTSGGDDTPVNEVEVLECSLGHWRGHIRGVGRTVKSVTPDFPPHMYVPTNELQQQLAEANVH